MDILRLLSAVAGIATILMTFYWALVTLMVRDTDPPRFTRMIFRVSRNGLNGIARIMKSERRRKGLRALYIPLSLLTIVWVAIAVTTVGYSLLFYGVSDDTYRKSYINSVSSMSVLGIGGLPDSLTQTTIAGIEAFTGPILVALLISYIAGMYSTISQQRATMQPLDAGIGHATNGAEIMLSAADGKGVSALSKDWADWAAEFKRLEASYESIEGYLMLFAPNMEQHWTENTLTILDSANLRKSLIELPVDRNADRCLADGTRTIEEVVDHYQHQVLTFHTPPALATIDRDEFDRVAEQLSAAGMTVVADRSAAWEEFQTARERYADSIARLSLMLVTPDSAAASRR